ncbi:MAG: TolC family protein [Balneolia bacterium]|nr:TolC family protein [Balneolia bacterium]
MKSVITGISFSFVMTVFVWVMPFVPSSGFVALAQSGETLTLEQAFERALQNNHAIRIERFEQEQSSNSVFRGNAGQLPVLSLSGSAELSRNDVEIELADFESNGADPRRISVDGAESRTLSAGVEMSYTIFDGFSGRYRYRQLQAQDRLTRLSVRMTIESTLLEVAEAYFGVLQAEEELRIVSENLDLSELRLQTTREALQFGNARRLDVLNAEVNLNNDRISVEQAENGLQQANRALLFALGMEFSDGEPVLTDDFTVQDEMPLDELLQSALTNNAMVKLADEEISLAEIQRRLEGTGRFPSLTASARYGYVRQDNDAGNFTYLEELGYTAMLSLRYDIFDGGVTRRSVQNARIAEKSREENKQMMLKQVEKDLLNAFSDFQTQLRQLDIANLNVETAELNFEDAEESVRVGTISSIELREAQINLQNARLTQNELRYGLKQQEMILLLLSGTLLES